MPYLRSDHGDKSNTDYPGKIQLADQLLPERATEFFLLFVHWILSLETYVMGAVGRFCRQEALGGS